MRVRAGSKIDVEALKNRARAEQFPCQLQKKDSTIMCVRPGLEISETEEVTVCHEFINPSRTV